MGVQGRKLKCWDNMKLLCFLLQVMSRKWLNANVSCIWFITYLDTWPDVPLNVHNCLSKSCWSDSLCSWNSCLHLSAFELPTPRCDVRRKWPTKNIVYDLCSEKPTWGIDLRILWRKLTKMFLRLVLKEYYVVEEHFNIHNISEVIIHILFSITE